MEIDSNTWTHPGTGEVREYINNWFALCGFEIDYYNTGNIRSATLDGEHVSNTRAALLGHVKVYTTAQGRVCVTSVPQRLTAVITQEEIVSRVKAALNAGAGE